MLAFRRQRVDSAFEAVEIMRDAIYDDLEAFVVIVPTNFTDRENFAGFLTHTTSIVRKDIKSIHKTWHDRFHSRGG